MNVRTPLFLLALSVIPVDALAQPAAATELTLGSPAVGELSAADELWDVRGTYADRWTFAGAAGQSVEIRMESDVVDAYLVLMRADGTVLAEDDDGAATGVDSRIRMTLPSDAVYTVLATSYTEAIGPYALFVEPHTTQPLQVSTLSVGTPAAGRLSADDRELEYRGYVDAFDFEVEAGTALQLSLRSSDFDAWLALVGPTGEQVAIDDDGGVGTDSLIQHTVATTGAFRAVVSSFSAGATGAYTLEATEGFSGPTGFEGTPIAIGEPVSGVLEDGDDGAMGGVGDVFSFEVDAGQQVTIELSSNAFDTFVALYDPAGNQVASQDDVDGTTNSRLIHVAGSTGTWAFEVRSYDESGRGPYTTSVSLADPPPVVQVALELGATVEGRLGPGDAHAMYGGFVDVYAFEADAGTDLAPIVQSPTGYPSFRVFGPTGDEVIGMGDRIGVLSLPMTGRYLIAVSSYESTALDYTLTVGGVPEPGAAVPYELGAVVEGELTADDDRVAGRNTLADRYMLEIASPTMVSIRMQSDIIDGYLLLEGADGRVVAENDDYEDLNPGIDEFLAAGTYTIVATSYGTGATGAYTLTAGAVESGPVQISSIAIGDTVTGTIEESDARSATRGTASDFYRFEAGAGQSVTIDMTSELIDPYLMVLGPLGEVIAENDDWESLDARVVVTLPESGVYTIVATRWDASSGAYQLEIREGAEEGPASFLPY